MIGGQPYYGSRDFMIQLGQGQDSEDLNVCQSTKLLHLTHHDQAQNPLNISYTQLTATLNNAITTVQPPFQLEPLFRCP